MAYYKCGSVYTTQNSNVVIDTASGAIANFETPLAIPLLDAQVDVNAVQDLHGQSGAYPAGGGVNKFDKDTMLIDDAYINDTDGSQRTWAGDKCTDFIEIAPNTTYFIYTEQTTGRWGAWYDENKNYISGIELYGLKTSPANAKYVRFTVVRQGNGNPDTFSVNYPSTDTAYHPYSNICPINGWDKISVVKCGRNLFDISTKTDDKALKWSDGDVFNATLSIVSDYIEVKEGVRFTSNYNAQWCCYDKNKNYLGNIVIGSLVTTSGNDTTTNTIPSGYGVYYLRLGFRSSTNNNANMTEKTDIVLSVGNIALTFESYNSSTTLINLGGTYYGGHFTQDKDGHRQFVVTHGIKLFGDISFSRSNNSGAWQGYLFYAQISDKVNGGVLKCSNYEYVIQTTSTMQNEKIISTGSSKYIYVRDDAYTTVADFKTANANTQLVYPLATPIIINLPDGEPIITLNGTNNIYADTGDTTVKFRKIGD